MGTSHNPKNTKSTEFDSSTQDIYAIFQNNLNRYFTEVKGNTADYLQAITDLQQEIIEARKKNADNAIQLQKILSEKLGVNSNNYIGAIELTKSLGEQMNQSWDLQNQLMLKSLDTLSKNIEAFNKNSAVFETISKNIINSWASIIKQTVKESNLQKNHEQ